MLLKQMKSRHTQNNCQFVFLSTGVSVESSHIALLNAALLTYQEHETPRVYFECMMLQRARMLPEDDNVIDQ